MIGIVGAGEIVAAAHLPAYAKLNLPVEAIFDTDHARAKSLSERSHVRYAPDLEALLNEPRVEIVDVAVPPFAQVSIIEAALKSGKHVLAQKPLAPTLQQALRLADLAERCHRRLVINQQMRWSPVVNAIRMGVADGTLGDLQRLTFYLDLPFPPGRFPGWLGREPRFVVLFNTIHFLDTSRFLLGEPSSVVAVIRNGDKHIDLKGEIGATVALDFPDGAEVYIVDQRNAYGDHQAFFRADGTNGALRGRFGLWTNYPTGVDDEIEYTRARSPGNWKPIPVEGRWIPDAFTGPITELVAAIQGGPEPTTSGRDHSRTLELVEAVYASAASGGKISLKSK